MTKRSHGRGDRIRTCGPMLPKHVRYQTAPHPGKGGCQMTCQFCDAVYEFSAQEIGELIDRLSAAQIEKNTN